MGSYKEIKGDLLELFDKGEFDLIAHGCNCHKSMGAGIARQIRDAYPTAYVADWHDKRDPLQRLGDYTYDPYCDIYNLYTQFNPGKDLNYVALTMCFIKLNKLYSFSKTPARLGLPQIGCGIAGGDWDKVREIIKETLTNFDVTVVIYDKSK